MLHSSENFAHQTKETVYNQITDGLGVWFLRLIRRKEKLGLYESNKDLKVIVLSSY